MYVTYANIDLAIVVWYCVFIQPSANSRTAAAATVIATFTSIALLLNGGGCLRVRLCLFAHLYSDSDLHAELTDTLVLGTWYRWYLLLPPTHTHPHTPTHTHTLCPSG